MANDRGGLQAAFKAFMHDSAKPDNMEADFYVSSSGMYTKLNRKLNNKLLKEWIKYKEITKRR